MRMFIEDWSISSDGNPYQAPELRVSRVIGKVYGNVKFNDGKVVSTSAIVELNLEKGYCRTLNSVYDLGKVSEQYKAWCVENGFNLKSFNNNIEGEKSDEQN